MPLHLLGKKSWNVYNTENVERVRRDEAEARAREDAEEQHMQTVDAERRIALLRGDQPPPLPEPVSDPVDAPKERRRGDDEIPRERKRRRLRGEDDTDRDIRYAQEDTEQGQRARTALAKTSDASAPLHDHAGHIQLIPAPDERDIRKAEKNAELEAEKAKKRKRDEDQGAMRFSDASGYNKSNAAPWYSKSASTEEASKALVLAEVEEKDVWGREDLRRKGREAGRIAGKDPMAVMRSAQRQLKQSEKDRQSWERTRMQEIEDLDCAAKEEERRKRQRRCTDREEDEGLETFWLDALGDSAPSHRRKERNYDAHRRRHRQSSHKRSHRRHSPYRAAGIE